jgi:hypothetical protein
MEYKNPLRVGSNNPHALTELSKSALSSSHSNSIMQTQQLVAVTRQMQNDTAFLLLARVAHLT